jgi:DNA-binding NtrC family response regulator
MERLEKYNLRLVAAVSRPLSALAGAGWDPSLIARLGDVWVTLPQLSRHVDEVPEIAALVLSHLIERHGVPPCRFSTAALNALRLHHWQGEWMELLATVKNLAIAALDDEITTEDVDSVLHSDDNALRIVSPPPLFSQTLREAREAFERQYLEHHLKNERGNMTRVAEKTGLERTHLYRKLKQLGLNLGRRLDEIGH